MDRPNQRQVRTAGAQIGMHSAQLEGLRSELYQLERLYNGGVYLRQTTENEIPPNLGVDKPTYHQKAPLHSARIL